MCTIVTWTHQQQNTSCNCPLNIPIAVLLKANTYPSRGSHYLPALYYTLITGNTLTNSKEEKADVYVTNVLKSKKRYQCG